MAFSAQARNGVVAEMNITPLVDVMLVLLIIFMVAVPMLSKTFELNLPQAAPDNPPPPETVTLRIASDGALTWEGSAIPAFAIDAAMRAEAGRKQPPVLNIEADPDAPYQNVAEAMSRAQRAGLERIALN
jgi:biopolymer transport protein ExbD